MKILYQSRLDLYDPKGGDTVQMEKTKNAIEKIDPSIKIDIDTSLKAKNINNYDLVHLFNLDWVCETYPQALWAKQHGKKIVLSAIHHSEDEVKLYESRYKFDIRRVYNLIFTSQPLRDEWKNVYRSVFNLKKLYPTILQILGGIRNLQHDILTLSDAVLVQTEKEAEDISKDFDIKVENWHKIVNGVDIAVFKNADNAKFIELVKQKTGVDLTGKKIILNVGRVEPRKNQLSLIQAFKSLKKRHYLDDYVLVFIGAFSKYSPEYRFRFNWNLKLKRSQIIYLGQQPHEYVAAAMSHPGIYVHPSWFETTGLVALEALVSGMKVVISGERAQEYLGKLADYCNPDNIKSIEYAILQAVERKNPSAEEVDQISKSYNWEETAKQTIKVYKELLNK
jgi:glycosyltransferase involved in cell wall biosynthesis